MRHESTLAAWIRSGGNSVFVLPLDPVQAPEVKFSVVPDRLLDSIIDDALAAGVARLNGFLPEGVSIDITSVDLTTIRDQLRTSVADRLNATGVAIANHAYANRIGNGDIESGDGWAYRGRGLFQLTGRGNYREFTEWHETAFGEGVDFEAEPDRAAEPVYAVRSAVFFWLNRGMSYLADAGLTDEATDAITRRINRFTDSDRERRRLMRRIRDSSRFDNICRFSVARPRFEDAE